MTREALLEIVEKAYEKRGARLEKSTCLVTGNKNEFGVSIHRTNPFIGAGFYLIFDEIEEEIKKTGGTVKQLGLYADYYIMRVNY